MAAAALTTAASLGLMVFFFAAKHRTPFARIVPFGEDPYDAVGSIGFQLALVASLISLLRGARRYDGAGVPAAQAALALRASITALLAVFVTIQADAVAMLRHPRLWVHSPIGSILAPGLVIVAIASLSGAVLLGLAHGRYVPESRPAWRRGAATILVCVALLALYPESWREAGLAGALGTALAGMALLFAETWALMLAIAPPGGGRTEDLLDDLAAVFGRAGAAPGRVTRWLRAAPWRLAMIVALAGGVGLAISQAAGEGLPSGAGRAALVLGVFTGLEAIAIILGYLFFRRPLALVREEAPR